jgi:uncharacterized protein
VCKFLTLLAVVVLPLLSVKASAGPSSAVEIGWNDLRSSASAAAQAGPDASGTLSWDLDGKTIQLAGYVLPSDREGELVYQFLLIPWTGLCSHMPPPPPNQAVLITLRTPYKLSETYETVSVTGVLKPDLEKTQLFMLDGMSVIESGYTMSSVEIAPADKVIGAAPQPKTNPWGFVRKKAGG